MDTESVVKAVPSLIQKFSESSLIRENWTEPLRPAIIAVGIVIALERFS